MHIQGWPHAYGFPSSKPTIWQQSRQRGLESIHQSVNKYLLKPYYVPSTVLSTGETKADWSVVSIGEDRY